MTHSLEFINRERFSVEKDIILNESSDCKLQINIQDGTCTLLEIDTDYWAWDTTVVLIRTPIYCFSIITLSHILDFKTVVTFYSVSHSKRTRMTPAVLSQHIKY